MPAARDAIETTAERSTLHAYRMMAADVPTTLSGVLQARPDRLPPPDRRALQLAGVIGPTFWDAALAHLDAAAAARLPSLQARALVHRKDATGRVADHVCEYRFDHRILHQVTNDTVLRRVKRQAHARAADWLAHHAGARSKSVMGAAAEHFEKADDSDHAAAFYARAAEHMAGTLVHDVALDYTARAPRLARSADFDLRWRLLANRERVLDLLGRRDAQLADIAALQVLARGDALQARALARRLLTEARAAARSTGPFAGAYEHLIRLTLHRVRAASDPHCAHQLLVEAHAA